MSDTRNYPARFTALCSVPFAAFMGLGIITDPPAANAAPCPATMNFAVGGTGDPTGVNTPGVPAGPRTNVWYPATVDDNAQRIGRDNLTNAVNSFRAQCPNSHVSVYGFSGGAQIAGDWRDMNPGIRNAHVTLIGDPRAPGGLAAILPSVPGWWTNNGPRPSSPIPTTNICRQNDPVCNLGNPFADPIHAINTLIGWFQGAHGYSPQDTRKPVGDHMIPAAPAIPEVVKLPIKVTPRQVSPVEPFVPATAPRAQVPRPVVPTPAIPAPVVQAQKQWTPPAVARGTAARNVGEVIPPALAGFIPPQLASIPLPH